MANSLKGSLKSALHHGVDRRKRLTRTLISLNPASGCDVGPYRKSQLGFAPGGCSITARSAAMACGHDRRHRRSARSRIAW